MSMPPPEPHPETVQPRAPMSDDAAKAEARRIIRDFATSYRDDTPLPAVGDSPPVAQPGRPPMSQRSTGASVMLIAGGFFSLCLGAAVSAVMHFSQTANETVVITLCAAPPATFLALGGLIKRARASAPDEHHHHYSGPVVQDHSTVTNNNRWWGRSSTRGKGD